MKITEITWPVYKLGIERPNEVDDVLFFIQGDKSYIVDDKRIKENSLAKRRLQLMLKNVELYKLKYAFFFLGDFLKVAKPKIWFIDSAGKIFKYTKIKYAKLICRKITNIIPSIGCTYIEVERLPSRYVTLFTPTVNEKYAGFLNFDGVYIFYGLYTERFQDTRKMV